MIQFLCVGSDKKEYQEYSPTWSCIHHVSRAHAMNGSTITAGDPYPATKQIHTSFQTEHSIL